MKAPEPFQLIHQIYNDLMYYELKNLQAGLDVDITITEIHTIAEIGPHGCMTMNVLADRCGVKPSTMTIMINKLVKKGFVERYRSEEDRRIVQVRLTENGKNACQKHESLHKEVSGRWFDVLSGNEQTQLLNIMEKISKAIQ